VTSVDQALADAVGHLPPVQPDASERWRTDPFELLVGLTWLAHSLVEQGGSVEEFEAIRGFAADRLGGPRPRRTGARRWVRKREYDKIPHRLAMLSERRDAPSRLHAAYDAGSTATYSGIDALSCRRPPVHAGPVVGSVGGVG
jgi:hypothetical protein